MLWHGGRRKCGTQAQQRDDCEGKAADHEDDAKHVEEVRRCEEAATLRQKDEQKQEQCLHGDKGPADAARAHVGGDDGAPSMRLHRRALFIRTVGHVGHCDSRV